MVRARAQRLSPPGQNLFPSCAGEAPPGVRALPTLVLFLVPLAGCGGGGGGGGGAPPALVADFAADVVAGEAPLRVAFQDRSSGGATAWSWDFGDGTGSSEREPLHTYDAAGTFAVNLTVTRPGALASAHRPAFVEVRARPALAYGMNPSLSRWSSREIVFADAMMRASEFLIVRAGELTTEPAPLVPLGRQPPRLGQGWPDLAALAPGDAAGAWLFGPMEGTLPDGRATPWILTWEGTGNCRLFGTATLGETRRTPRRVEARVDPTVGNGNGTVALLIESSSRSDPVRNVRVWLPGMLPERPLFWPPYLARVQAMNHGTGPRVWRTLDWTRVNDHGAQDPPLPFEFDLAGRIFPWSPSQGTRRGVCPEFQAAFCNAVGADLHFQVPHRAEPMTPADYELYLRDVFTRLRDGAPAVPGINGDRPFEGLAEERELVLELSNEMWNAFPVNRWLRAQAMLRGLTLHEVIAEELLSVWRIADEVFAGRRTVRRFVGGFVAEADFAGRILAALPPGTRVDQLGPACYFRPQPETIARWLEGAVPGSCPACPTPEEVLAAAWLSFPDLGRSLRAHRRLAESHANPDGSHPRLVLYEAGQALDARGAPWAGAARVAQTLPEMYRAYVDGLVPLLVAEGVAGVNWYSFMTDPDPSHGVDVGYGIWDDMAQTITLPVPEPYRDEGAPKAAAIYRGSPPR
ncbi:MAG TPA: PKD domain-containing protein [Planctomycetota bacterium]